MHVDTVGVAVAEGAVADLVRAYGTVVRKTGQMGTFESDI